MKKKLKTYLKKKAKQGCHINLDQLIEQIKRHAILKAEYDHLKKSYNDHSESVDDIDHIFDIIISMQDLQSKIMETLEPLPILKMDNLSIPFDDIRIMPDRAIYIHSDGNTYIFGVDLPRDVYEKLVYCTNYELFD